MYYLFLNFMPIARMAQVKKKRPEGRFRYLGSCSNPDSNSLIGREPNNG